MSSKSKKVQIHATNINGLGAINVVEKLIESILKNQGSLINKIYVSENIKLKEHNLLIKFKRRLPNFLSRLIEICFPSLFFENLPTLVLGDIPLRGIQDQVVFVHQANLIKPKINQYASKHLKFYVLRLMFAWNLKYAKRILVQSDFMKEELLKSYPNKNLNIEVIPLPEITKAISRPKKTNSLELALIYPALAYKHKNHRFLFDIEKITSNLKFKIYVTLPSQDFRQFNKISFVENLGVLPHHELLKKLNAFDAILNLSNIESFCLPLSEAIYLNKPIITIKRNYSEWMCEQYAYYFENVETFFEQLKILQNDILFNNTKKSELAKNKFKLTWNEVGNRFLTYFTDMH